MRILLELTSLLNFDNCRHIKKKIIENLIESRAMVLKLSTTKTNAMLPDSQINLSNNKSYDDTSL